VRVQARSSRVEPVALFFMRQKKGAKKRGKNFDLIEKTRTFALFD
jgi:hypothetical protein